MCRKIGCVVLRLCFVRRLLFALLGRVLRGLPCWLECCERVLFKCVLFPAPLYANRARLTHGFNHAPLILSIQRLLVQCQAITTCQSPYEVVAERIGTPEACWRDVVGKRNGMAERWSLLSVWMSRRGRSRSKSSRCGKD